ncbi:STAS/SEC14 domain-containing protein [Stappia sp. ES.058]|uniref:STAS/SEC14 domain-containing protein n=1 Tax=Stappia sp. ES.058 TaxID=1881061 RepID=UPI00087BAE7A|nr:STAS/SEC14 domain-containing protein [Stappia sp. ES.058]SDU16152.1 SpoIIAA-like [Stappia sp. ES.058]
MIEIEHLTDEDIIVIRASGTLTAQDYDSAVPELEHALDLSKGSLRVLVRLEGFKGWEMGALWRELKFDLKHLNDFGRIAVVGERTLEKWGTTLSAPFTKADMRFFSTDKEAEAQEWLGMKGKRKAD